MEKNMSTETVEVAVHDALPNGEIVGKLLAAIEGHNIAEVFAGIATMIDVVCDSVGVEPTEVITRMSIWFHQRGENELEH
jgi:hypothetical protein